MISTTEYAAIRYGSTPSTDRYVMRDGRIIGAVSFYLDEWHAMTVEGILDSPRGTIGSAPTMAGAAALVDQATR